MQNKNHFSKKILEHLTRHLLFPLTVPECEEVVGTSEKRFLSIFRIFFLKKERARRGWNTRARRATFFPVWNTHSGTHISCRMSSEQQPQTLGPVIARRNEKMAPPLHFQFPQFSKKIQNLIYINLFILKKLLKIKPSFRNDLAPKNSKICPSILKFVDARH